MVSWPSELAVVLLFLVFERSFQSRMVEPGTLRWWFRRFLSWVESTTATGNPLVLDSGGRQRPHEKFGLTLFSSIEVPIE